MQKRWLVDLSEAERVEVEALTRRGKAPARKIAHARMLLLACEGLTDGESPRPRVAAVRWSSAPANASS